MEPNDLFDNELLFDAEGHLTDGGLRALQDDRLDDLGRLEAAEHLTFCDYCLARYTALIEAAPQALRQPMRDLIPQVQNLMRLRSFRIMTNRYVSTAAAVLIAFAVWQFGLSGISSATKRQPAALQEPRVTVSQSISGALDRFSSNLNQFFDGLQSTVTSGLSQLADHSNPSNLTPKNGGSPADGE